MSWKEPTPARSSAIDEIRLLLDEAGVPYERYDDRKLPAARQQDIADGAVTGWFQGRMEFGPRALGNRSIVADPRRADMKEILNERIKKREPFRPFAPSILEEHTAEYFEQDHPSPTMLMVYQVREEKRAVIPAVTHVDGSGRLQTVNARYEPALLSTDFRLLRTDRSAGSAEHLVQRKRADRLHAAARARMLP